MRHQRFWAGSLAGLLTSLLLFALQLGGSTGVSVAQSTPRPNLQPSYISAEQIATRFYQQVPNFPKADNYKVTNSRITIPSTLVERLVLYHTLVKGRSPQRRFDWKLTLADFLGMNDPISAQSYPGREYLDRNPLEDDRAIVQQFNRQQRNQLIQALVDLYTPTVARQAAPAANPVAPPSAASPTPQSPQASPARIPPSPQQGGAQLLSPSTPTGPAPIRPSGDARLLLP